MQPTTFLGRGAIQSPTKTALWIALIVASSFLFSFVFACATPLAAVACLAAVTMSRRQAFAWVGVAWFANQTVGYLVLDYPRTWDSFGWGAAIGVAALIATVGAQVAARISLRPVVSLVAAFVAAFLVYEGTLFAASAILPSGAEAFSLPSMGLILWVNAVALSGLFVAYRVAVAIGLIVSEAKLSLQDAQDASAINVARYRSHRRNVRYKE
jgi:hypothetical protein